MGALEAGVLEGLEVLFLDLRPCGMRRFAQTFKGGQFPRLQTLNAKGFCRAASTKMSGNPG